MKTFTRRHWVVLFCALDLTACTTPALQNQAEHAFQRYLTQHAVSASPFTGPFQNAPFDADRSPEFYWIRCCNGKTPRIHVRPAHGGVRPDSVYVDDPQLAWQEVVAEQIIAR